MATTTTRDAWLLTMASLGLPAPAFACPVCGVSATEQGQTAYIVMSVVLSLLPLLGIGGLVAWVAVRMRAASGTAERPRDSRRD